MPWIESDISVVFCKMMMMFWWRYIDHDDLENILQRNFSRAFVQVYICQLPRCRTKVLTNNSGYHRVLTIEKYSWKRRQTMLNFFTSTANKLCFEMSSLNQNNKTRLKWQDYVWKVMCKLTRCVSTAWEISSEVSIWLIVPIVHLWVRMRENTWSITNSDSNSERIYNQPLERSLPGQHVICCICFLVAWKTQLLLLFCEPRDPEGNDLA